jgi:hypothetical protein
VAAGDGSADGSAEGVAAGSVDGAGLSIGGADGSAAIVPTGATIANSRRTICRPMMTRRTRKNRREAVGEPNIDMTPLPGRVDPLTQPGARSEMAIAIG